MTPPRFLRVATFPFETRDSIDAARLSNCKAAFAYVDGDDDQVKTIPACIWTSYRNDLLRKASRKYGINRRESDKRAVSEVHEKP